MTGITLAEAAKTYWFRGLDLLGLRRQDEAFGICLSFLQNKAESQNLRYDSYALTQIVQNPAGHFRFPACLKCHSCPYIYEGHPYPRSTCFLLHYGAATFRLP
jgi:hypothetical protein